MTSRAILNGWPIAAGNFSSFGPLPPRPTGLYALATKDGSVGQVYSAPAAMTNRQWYRETLAAPVTRTAIAGATGGTRTATSDDIGSRLVVSGIVDGYQVDAKALHVVYDVPILLEGFENATDFTASAGAILSTVTAGKVQGTAAMQLVGDGTGNPRATKTNIGTLDPANWGVVSLYTDLGQDPVYQCVSSVYKAFTRSGTTYLPPNNGFSETTYQTPAPLFHGGFWDSFNVSEVGSSFSTIGSGQVGIVVGPGTNVPNVPTIKHDALMARSGGRPTIMLDFDDVFASQYDTAWPILKARNVPVTINVIANRMDQLNRLTTDQLREMVAGGCDLGLNSTDDGPLTGKGSTDAAIADLLVDRQWCTDRGFASPEHLVYPNGTYQTNGTKVLINSVTSDGSATVTLGTASSTITVGMVVAGRNVPAGTTVSAVNSTTSLTLSNTIPAQAKPMSFTDTSGPFSTNKLPTALRNAGFKSARTTLNRGGQPTRFGVGGRDFTLAGNPTSNRTQQQIIDLVNPIILRGQTAIFYTHSILTGASGVDTETSFYQWFINYLADLRDAGTIDILTRSQWWMRDGNAGVPL